MFHRRTFTKCAINRKFRVPANEMIRRTVLVLDVYTRAPRLVPPSSVALNSLKDAQENHRDRVGVGHQLFSINSTTCRVAHSPRLTFPSTGMVMAHMLRSPSKAHLHDKALRDWLSKVSILSLYRSCVADRYTSNNSINR